MSSIFTELLQSRSNSREDFLTVAFTGLLRVWAEQDDQGFRDFVHWFSGKTPTGQLKEIKPHRSAGIYGTPDLWIIFEDLLILAENKWDAKPDPEQIKRYHDYLGEYRKENPSINTSLVFMNPSPHTVEWIKEPNKDITWSEISKFLEKVNGTRLNNGYSEFRYYKRQFLQFLEDYDMIDKPVSWQYMEGVPALLVLVSMIKTVLDELVKEGLVSISAMSFGSQWAGYYFQSPDGKNKFWFGQSFNGEYDYLWFNTEELTTWKVPDEEFEPIDNGKNFARYFFFAEHFFFSRDALGQREEIKKFLKETLGLFIKP